MRKRVTPLEHVEQCALITWWDWYAERRFSLDRRLLFAIPNAGAGAQRGQAGKMRAEGVRSSIPDLLLAVPRWGSHGLFLEMKRIGERRTPAQLEMGELLAAQGYRVREAAGLQAAQVAILEYLGEKSA